MTTTIVLTLLSASILAFNLLVIAVILRHKQLRNSQLYYRVSMAASDVIVSTAILPSMIGNMWFYALHSKHSLLASRDGQQVWARHSSSAYDKSFTMLSYFTGSVTSYSFVFACADRLTVVLFPLFYRSHDMKKASKCICVLIWLVSFSFVMFYGFNCKRNCYYYYFLASLAVTARTDMYVNIFYNIIIKTILVIILSFMTAFVLRSNNLKTKTMRFDAHHKKIFKTEVKLAKNLMLVVLSFLLMVTPLFVCYFTTQIRGYSVFGRNYENYLLFFIIFYISQILFICGTIWNFLIYVWRNKSFRECLFKLLKKHKQNT